MSARPEALVRLGELAGRVYTVGFSAWKRPYLRLCSPRVDWHAVDDPAALPDDARVLAWGAHARRVPARIRRVWHVEDGFLRSVGLGAELVRPLSWVIDSRAPHYDPTRPSDLEDLLGESVAPALCAEATRLRDEIVAAGLTKYNVGAARWQPPSRSHRLVVVPGQVESDEALRRGAPGVNTNLALLQAVRRLEPSAYVVFKTHPDVAARLRAPGAGEADVRHWCDAVVTDAPIADLIAAADVLHVMTSLAGFEALLRRRRVVCHGQPFYAGWGLTHDLLPLPRRSRRLTIDELVTGALLRYPVYFARDARRLGSAAQTVDELIRWRAATGHQAPWWRPAWRVVLRQTVGMR